MTSCPERWRTRLKGEHCRKQHDLVHTELAGGAVARCPSRSSVRCELLAGAQVVVLKRAHFGRRAGQVRPVGFTDGRMSNRLPNPDHSRSMTSKGHWNGDIADLAPRGIDDPRTRCRGSAIPAQSQIPDPAGRGQPLLGGIPGASCA